jgi:hypothetical protein
VLALALRAYERFKQLTLGREAALVLGVPLDGNDETLVSPLESFNYSVGRARGNYESISNVGDGLMVP